MPRTLMREPNLEEFDTYSLCQCGAITFFSKDGNKSFSCHSSRLRDFIGEQPIRAKMLTATYMCDHCVNHYGLDLCGCGCGREFGHCEFGDTYESSKRPMQSLFAL